ncbi:MAG: arginine deiminase family protein [Bacteroidales bacterium]|jgi:arginine deiminase|nr:arginine deiminase family protein [Bacteroidales bacterium]MDD2771718.1 arginine deiminase family protein [Bacteroidales bacterium]MDD3105467.1 arginine deiminase family protein [Bacteroidales bacterium]MDD3550079.1 arginine deiminase family protein [Bacteroidales bacterium]MDD4064537.1 arginine deiminase family protein [Bacteroidales bacterium]
MNEQKFNIEINSEIGELEAVMLHTPGPEVENMTPKSVERALYSDILNLSVAQQEYEQLSSFLEKITKVYQLKDLLIKVLDNPAQRNSLVGKICLTENVNDYFDELMEMSSRTLANKLIEGLPARIDSLTSFLNDEYYALLPLYNFYFTRDASAVVGNNAVICRMANKVRVRESLIMEAIYAYNPYFNARVINTYEQLPHDRSVLMEGGDILVVRDDILVIGNGMRTTSQGIDLLLNRLAKTAPQGKSTIFVQQLPSSPESFIHLDMVFTMLDVDKCMVFEPLILGDARYSTVQITLDNGKVEKIRRVPNLLTSLRRLGLDMEAISCGGNDEWDQEREQWHSGANFFAFAPGKVMSYARNEHTLNEMSKHGFEIVTSEEVTSGKVNINKLKKCVVTIVGAELARGGGGARCMTLPLKRKAVTWV